jgi:hypothetical protein
MKCANTFSGSAGLKVLISWKRKRRHIKTTKKGKEKMQLVKAISRDW